MELDKKLIKLHSSAKTHLDEVMMDATEEGKEVDQNLLFSQSFFMGVVAGVLLEKRPGDSARELINLAQDIVAEVPSRM